MRVRAGVCAKGHQPAPGLPDAIEDGANELGGLARLALQRVKAPWAERDAQMLWCDQHIAAHAKASDQVRQAEQLSGIGPVTVSESRQVAGFVTTF